VRKRSIKEREWRKEIEKNEPKENGKNKRMGTKK
jgi:hypothetical protein